MIGSDLFRTGYEANLDRFETTCDRGRKTEYEPRQDEQTRQEPRGSARGLLSTCDHVHVSTYLKSL
jgi:hypothetical protein